jgi:spermidine/putrescine transport system substrate-binding protein
MQGKRIISGAIKAAILFLWAALMIAVLYIGNEKDQDSALAEATDDHTVPTHRVLRLLVWGDIFDTQYLKAFEEQHNVSIQISSFDSNEELIVKLKASGGRGYDIISPSDYAVRILHNEELLKPLDHARMPFFESINPFLVHQFFDPENRYAIPYEWEVYGLAYDKEFFTTHVLENSWDMIFKDPHHTYKVVVSNDPLEMIRIAARYLFKTNIDMLSPEQLDQVTTLLVEQRAWVEAYTRTNLDYYLTAGYSPLAFASSAYVGRRKKFAHKMGFMLPREGGILTIEHLAVPLHAENEDLIYAFFEFVFSTFFPSVQEVDEPAQLDPEIKALRHMSADEFGKLIYIKQIMPEEEMNHLWVKIKA